MMEASDVWTRGLRTVAYLFISMAGFLLIWSPILTEVYSDIAEVMAWFLAVGGFLSFLGALVRRWWGEFMGLPLLASSFMVFALISTKDTYDVAPFIAGANFLLLSAIGLALSARWWETWQSYRLAIHIAKHSPGEENGDE